MFAIPPLKLTYRCSFLGNGVTATFARTPEADAEAALLYAKYVNAAPEPLGANIDSETHHKMLHLIAQVVAHTETLQVFPAKDTPVGAYILSIFWSAHIDGDDENSIYMCLDDMGIALLFGRPDLTDNYAKGWVDAFMEACKHWACPSPSLN